MPNITKSIIAAAREVTRLLHKHGAEMGQEVKDLIAQGDLSPYGRVQLTINARNIENMKPGPGSFPLVTNLFMKFGTTEAGIVTNGLIVFAGVYTGGRSAIQYRVTKNPLAKGFYAASVLCSGTAVANGGVAVMARACQISEIAILTESFGAAFMMLRNLAHVSALELEKKPISAHLQHVKRWKRKPLRPSLYNNQNLGFIMPGAGCGDFTDLSGIIANIPFEKMGKVIGFSISVYGYTNTSSTEL